MIRDPNARLSLSGLSSTAKAIYLVLLWEVTERPFLVVVDGNKQAETLSELIETFFDLLVTSEFRVRKPFQRLTYCRRSGCRRTPKSARGALSGCGG